VISPTNSKIKYSSVVKPAIRTEINASNYAVLIKKIIFGIFMPFYAYPVLNNYLFILGLIF
jgi:hypothetical protein